MPACLKIGCVEEEYSCYSPAYRVCDAEGNVLLRIEGPGCMCACGIDIVFQIKSADGAVNVGQITRQWPGFVNQLLHKCWYDHILPYKYIGYYFVIYFNLDIETFSHFQTKSLFSYRKLRFAPL